ncbi:hypothetical protein ACD661_16345 [Legionella lytica]|uniref:Reverse transcriptase (RNA-dependent DNA polymerase) n=1 Tax=Legionella lytica TaxID=96232 RepID=A0ABW8DBQ0_9GAMM
MKNATKTRDKVNVISYADDFVITRASREILEHQVKPAVIAFLGFKIRKYDNNKLLIKPSKRMFMHFLMTLEL